MSFYDEWRHFAFGWTRGGFDPDFILVNEELTVESWLEVISENLEEFYEKLEYCDVSVMESAEISCSNLNLSYKNERHLNWSHVEVNLKLSTTEVRLTLSAKAHSENEFEFDDDEWRFSLDEKFDASSAPEVDPLVTIFASRAAWAFGQALWSYRDEEIDSLNLSAATHSLKSIWGDLMYFMLHDPAPGELILFE